MAETAGISDKPEDFDIAFEKVILTERKKTTNSNKRPVWSPRRTPPSRQSSRYYN
jgi:hypothetical protein